MAESITQRYIAALEPHRHALFTRARIAAGDPLRAEGLLQSAIHATFEAYAASTNPDNQQLKEQFTQQLESAIREKFPSAPAAAAGEEIDAMPAATWARLVGAAQLEAVRAGKGKALNPDSVLLSPDPLLAPKKMVRPDDGDVFEQHPKHFFVMIAVGMLVLGIAVTVLISSRRSAVPATTIPATTHAAEPATQVNLQ